MRAAALLIILAGCSGTLPERTQPPAEATELELVEVARGLEQPVFLASVPETGTLAVAEQVGRIRALSEGNLREEPLLDIRDRVRSGGERGLLGFAFSSGYLFVDYTDLQGDTIIERYAMRDGRAVAGSEVVILRIEQPYGNHNGGMIAFGPDGMLYIGTGDGGSAGDPQNRAQDPHDLLGKILRLDVRPKPCLIQPCRAYTIPADNPFADGKDGAPEVWSMGWRNPWRFSFDRLTGDLWVGDVGQNAWEEIHLERIGSGGGGNYGWSAYEGTHVYDASRTAPGAIMPVHEYPRSGASSVVGGYVHRGDLADLWGTYVFADYFQGDLWTLTPEGDGFRHGLLLETDIAISSFGEDDGGNLFVLGHQAGTVHMLAAR